MSYKITIAPGGAVTVQGNPPVKPPASLTSAQDEALSVQVRNAIPMLTSVVCAHTFPDEASQFITALGKTVYVRGDCDPDFRKLYDALSNALELK